MNCPDDLINFEKVIGLRPSEDTPKALLYKNPPLNPITEECISKCAENADCQSFILFFNTSECYWLRAAVVGFQEYENVIDSNVAWFTKVCLDVPKKCDKLWIFDRIPGAILIGNDTKKLSERVTRRNCQQICLDETEFHCKSAKFFIQDEYLHNRNSTETLGTCVLSDTDRHLLPNSYRVSSFDEEYFENQCSDDATLNEFCSYDEFPNSRLFHSDVQYENKSKEECQYLCEHFSSFNCRGYSLIPTELNQIVLYRVHKFNCILHSEDTKVHGPKLLMNFEGSAYYERARCLNVSLSCTQNYMQVRYEPETLFRGKIYMNGYSEHLECSADGNGNEVIALKIPLFSNKCGVIEARSVGQQNRSLMTGTLVLQYHALIQTQGDRLIKVGCFFDNETKITLGTGVNVKNDPSNIGSSTIVNSSSLNPVVELRVVDSHDQNDVVDTQIGQELQLIIEINPPDVPYDIWAGHLIAMTESGHDSILLLDDRGCPTNLHIFSGLTKKTTNSTKQLVANFQAFKFTTSPIVKFSVIVHFCPEYCEPIECANTNITNRARRIAKAANETNHDYLKTNFSDDSANNAKVADAMPLEYVLVVRQSPLLPDKLIYGENNKILVAGYDFVTNEICVDYSLMLGIVIVWVLLQVIMVVACLLLIKKYKRFYEMECGRQSLEELHKNFGLGFSNLENRRVRWADRNEVD